LNHCQTLNFTIWNAVVSNSYNIHLTNVESLSQLTTAPNPNTATLESGSTLHVFHTAPSPVDTPQPNKHTFSKGASGAIFAHEISAKTVYSAIVEHPMKWKMGFPSLSLNRLVPSGMKPGQCIGTEVVSARHDMHDTTRHGTTRQKRVQYAVRQVSLTCTLSASNLGTQIRFRAHAKDALRFGTLGRVTRHYLVTRFD
jgi:hypothetical protein